MDYLCAEIQLDKNYLQVSQMGNEDFSEYVYKIFLLYYQNIVNMLLDDYINVHFCDHVIFSISSFEHTLLVNSV